MSSHKRPVSPRIRRRVQRSQYIVLPETPPVPKAHTARQRAIQFALILLLVMAAGAALLATPFTTQSGNRTPVVDALFTSASAVAVTGLVTVDTGTHWNTLGQAVILLLIQIGGLGFMVGAGIFFQISRRNASLSQSLFLRDGSPSMTLHEATTLARHIALFIFVTEAIGWLILTVRFSEWMPLGSAAWHGLFHAVSAFCNAGFDLEGDYRSLTGYHNSFVVNTAVMALIQMGALSYLVFRDLAASLTSKWLGRRRIALSIDAKIVLAGNALLLIAGFVAMLALEWNGMLGSRSIPNRLLAAGFQSVAARTAGFATVDWADANPITEFVWLAMMMIGGASGSTAGGVKIATFAIVFMAVITTFRGEPETEVFQRRIPVTLLTRAMAVIAAFLLIHFAGTLVLAASEAFLGGTDAGFIHLLFESMSALATVGLSTGITPDLTATSKLVLVLLMFVGRLGPLTLGYALQLRARPHRYRYPAGEVRIG